VFYYNVAFRKSDNGMNKKNDRLKILLVDDDRDMCESLADVLRTDSSYEVKYSISPIKALEMAKSEDFALVVIDYKMPEMDGVELLKHLKKSKPNRPVFILTAFISDWLIEETKQAGAERIISKFTWPEKILSYVKETLG